MFIKQQTILRDLGNNLIMRCATPQDADALSDFNGKIHGIDDADRLGVAAWTRDLLTRPHATLKPDDFTIVEETSTRRIVSSLNLIPQTWTYEGIEFGVGRPELVGTLPEFRGRGLVRAQFDVIHQWSAERGHRVQGITGIPYYYRQFGYEFALNLGGRRMGSLPPKVKEGESEKYGIRPADEKDISFMMSVYDHASKRSMVSAEWSEAHWYNNLFETSSESVQKLCFSIIERADSHEAVGYFAHAKLLGMTGINVFHYELVPGVSWLEVSPCVVRCLWTTGQDLAREQNRQCTTFGFFFGANHPVYDALGDMLPSVREPYAWYLRVPDLLGFLNHIKPALEKRLAESIASGHSGEYLIGTYPKGIKLILKNGRITFEDWKPEHAEDGNAGFPVLTFTQVLFGYRSFEELKYAFPDCWWSDHTTRMIIDILFPKKHSIVYGIS